MNELDFKVHSNYISQVIDEIFPPREMVGDINRTKADNELICTLVDTVEHSIELLEHALANFNNPTPVSQSDFIRQSYKTENQLRKLYTYLTQVHKGL